MIIDDSLRRSIINVKIWKYWRNKVLKSYFNRILCIMKAAVLCMVIIASLMLGAFRPELQEARQSLDLKTSAIVSLGFGSALCMLVNNIKKDKDHY